jgi:hypothetical protein
MYCSTANVEDYNLLQYDVDFVQNWCLDNSMKLNIGKTNSITFNLRLYKKLMAHSQCVKDFGILLGCKLYFHGHVYIFFFFCKA